MSDPAAAPPSTPLALEMIDVTVTSLRNPARVMFEGVNWQVAVGDFWAIGGLHASGKSDFMAVAAGVMPPARGTYRVFGRELVAGFEHERLAARLRLGLVFDGGQLLNHLTIAENVALPIRYHGNCALEDCAPAVSALLDLVQIADVADRPPGAVSRNWQQRAGLARALALQPEVLLLDSPLTGLDPRDTMWWLDLLVQLAQGHPVLGGRTLTIALTCDDLRPWRGRARQFAVLRNRSFVPLGGQPEAAVFGESFLQTFLGAEPALR